VGETSEVKNKQTNKKNLTLERGEGSREFHQPWKSYSGKPKE
jgi:hypothetical protein